MLSEHPSTLEIRRWAAAKGLPVSNTGKIPHGLIVAWNRANPDRPFVKGESYHGVNGYVHYGCKCEVCAEAGRRAQNARYHLDQEEKRQA